MSTDVILILVILLGFAGLYAAIKQLLSARSQSQLEDLVEKAFGMSAEKIAKQSRDILQSEKEVIKTDLQNKQQVIEKLVKQLQDDMRQRQEEIRELERDRTRKFTEITAALEQHRQLTDELKVTTKQLSSVLSNNQQRGEWGERIIEDLMTANGLVEGTHYVRQTMLIGTNLKPDVTLLLPNERKVAVDVKFPYSEIQKMAAADSKEAKKAHLQQFRRDLKEKIDKVALYINPGADTLDYSIMFVPNEMIFSFINQQFADLVDEAMGKRVLLVSPFTFLIVARTVMESYRNFMIGDRLKDIIKYVDEFVDEWGKFRGKFEKYGRSLLTLQADYDELTGTRARQLDKKIEKITSYKQGSLLSSESTPLAANPKSDLLTE